MEVKIEESVTPKRPPRGMTGAERERILLSDGRISVVEPHQVKCKICDRLIKLHRTRPYELWNWSQHIKKCETKYASGQQTIGNSVVDLASDSDSEADVVLITKAIVLSPSVRPLRGNPTTRDQ